MKHIIKNIRDFAKNQTLFFVLMILCVVGSSIIMLFSFGVYQDYRLQKEEFSYNHTYLSLKFYELSENQEAKISYGVTKNELEDCIVQMSENTHDALEVIAVCYYEKKDNFAVYSRFTYQNDKYMPSKLMYESQKNLGGVIDGYFYTEEIYNSGEHIVTVTESEIDSDGQWHYQGIEYEPILILASGTNEVPFPSIPDNTVIEDITFAFYLPPSSAQYNEIVDTFKAKFGDKMVLDPIEPFYQEDYWLYDTIIMVAVLIAIVAAVNIVILYHYILLKRRKTLAVFMLCGCTKSRTVAMYLAESMLLTVPMYALSAAFYHYLLMPVLEKVFPFISTAYSFKLYALVFAIYVVVCALAMFILSSIMVRKHSIVEVKAGGI